MAMSSGSGKKGPVSEINVTPLVDVMLVLLVIFMVTAPMLFSGINLKLPRTQKVNTLSLKKELVILSLTQEGEFFLGKKAISESDVIPLIKKKFSELKTDVIYLRADYGLRYEKVARLMARLKNSGISNIALVTEVDKE